MILISYDLYEIDIEKKEADCVVRILKVLLLLYIPCIFNSYWYWYWRRQKWPHRCYLVCPQLGCSRQHQAWYSRSGRWWVGRCRWRPCPWSSWLCGSSHTLASVKGQVLLVKTVFWDFCFSGWKCHFWDVAVCAILPFHLPIWKGTPLRQWWGPSSARTRCEPSSTARSTPASGSCFPPRCLGLLSRN